MHPGCLPRPRVLFLRGPSVTTHTINSGCTYSNRVLAHLTLSDRRTRQLVCPGHESPVYEPNYETTAVELKELLTTWYLGVKVKRDSGRLIHRQRLTLFLFLFDFVVRVSPPVTFSSAPLKLPRDTVQPPLQPLNQVSSLSPVPECSRYNTSSQHLLLHTFRRSNVTNSTLFLSLDIRCSHLFCLKIKPLCHTSF